MGQALYRKYRSKSLDTVVGQEHITTTLAHALKSGKLAHAYLFTGPRGVGKTSIARILAHEINGLPYEDDSSHLDIIEIDAASNRRIDEIRELRDKVNIAPAQAKYKVYIIDEVHMLTREAFNALLKTLEEPPAHAVFILATTESHKLPETIISRTQRFMFKPVEQAKVTAHLKSLAKSEKIKITDEALALIAAYGEGSFRDSISLLDQTRGYSGSGDVDGDYVRLLIGQPTDEAITAVIEALARHDAAQLTLTLANLREQGFTAPQVAKHLGQRLRADILQGSIPHGVFDLLQKLLDVPSAHDPESYLELVVLEHALSGQMSPAPVPTDQPARAAVQAVAVAATTPAPTVKTPPAAKAEAKPEAKQALKTETKDDQKSANTETPVSLAPPAPVAETEAEPTATVAPADAKPLDEMTWPQVLDCLKKTHNSLYGIARMGRPEFNEDRVEIYFKFAFHQKRLNEAKNRDLLIAAIRTTCGRDVAVQCKLEEKGAAPAEPFSAALESAATPPSSPAPAPTAPATPVPVTDPATLAAINNIFGSAEVLGS